MRENKTEAKLDLNSKDKCIWTKSSISYSKIHSNLRLMHIKLE